MIRHARHPNHEQYRVFCSSGFILGRAVPLPPFEPLVDAYKGSRKRTPEQIARIRAAVKKAWAKRKSEAWVG